MHQSMFSWSEHWWRMILIQCKQCHAPWEIHRSVISLHVNWLWLEPFDIDNYFIPLEILQLPVHMLGFHTLQAAPFLFLLQIPPDSFNLKNDRVLPGLRARVLLLFYLPALLYGSHLPHGFKCHLHANDPQMYTLGLNSTLEIHSIPNISTWVSNRYLNFSMHKNEFPMSLLKAAFPPVFPISNNGNAFHFGLG